MSKNTPKIEIVDFKLFPKKVMGDSAGIVFGKITHGITINHFSGLIMPYQLDENGEPKISLEFATKLIRYSATSEVLVALQYLQSLDWFDSKVKFQIDGIEPFDQIVALNWSNEWNIKAEVDLAFYLDDIREELELNDLTYSQEWYYAKIANLHFSEGTVQDVAMTMGILLSQLWSKIEFESAALRGNASVASLDKANEVRKARSLRQSDTKNRIIAQYWHEGLVEFGAETMRRDSNAAQAIFVIASRKRPKELLVKSTGEIIGDDAIRKRVAALRKLGKIG